MSKLVMVARLALGAIFFVFGLNGFLHFMPMPELPAAAAAFMTGLGGSGYFFTLLKGTEVITGALLILGIYVPLALVILAPIVLNIALFHIFLAPDGMVMGIVILLIQLYLMWAYRASYDDVLDAKATPDA